MIPYLVMVCIIVLFLFWVTEYLANKQVEADLNLLLGDFMIARDSSEGRVRTHYAATVQALKTLIKKNFKD